ncbi:MAG: hypothetical protein HGJ94_16010 [Desulfosarcina sp.]|nr:hypothetical protein [Desulfosarcina sp.]MBC2745188.1 hypothetical protein [Desulfosarcina sp.]MBC2768096.1 hypothetical protein [Desulfosarcina sp.]
MATPLKINHLELAKLLEKGWPNKKIAAHFGCSPGAVSQAKKRMGVAICHAAAIEKSGGVKCKAHRHHNAAIDAAPVLISNADDAKAQISTLISRCNDELNWIGAEVAREDKKEYRAWQEAAIKHVAEIRKLISALADIEYKLHHVGVVEKALLIMFEEIGRESPECQKRIRNRLEKASIVF